MTKTYIKGKDEALEVSIEKMQAQLQALGFDIEEALWLNPVSNIFSVNIQDKNCPLLFTNGKGSTQNACLASALGEFFERLNCNYFFADYYLGNKIAHDDFVHYPNEKWFPSEDSDADMRSELLTNELWSFYDPEKQLTPELLVDTNSGNRQRGVCALPFVRHSDQQTIWFPVNIIGNLYVSNGMSAGNTMMEARTQALSEIFERYVKNRIIAEGISLPEVPDHIVELYPRVLEAITELEKEGFIIEVKDASLGGRYPVISVLMMEPDSGRCLASFGAHPSFEVALDRTITELLQGRRLDSLDGFQTPCFDAEAVADPVNLETHFIDSSGLISYDFFKKDSDYEFVYWDFDNSTQSEFGFLLTMFDEENKEIYIADYEHLGVYGCRIIAPGVSEIYPVDELSWQNNNEGLALRERVLSLGALNIEQAKVLLQELEESDYSDHSDVCGLIGVAPDPQSVWESLRIGELKGMLALHSGEFEQALEWAQWCLEMAQISAPREKLYRALVAMLEIQLDQSKTREMYRDGLDALYGLDTVERCIALIDGERHYDGLFDAGLELNGLQRHQKLLAAYEKLQEAKRKF
ncbi:MAG: YcaO-like family protein [gamma proteobacterium symbiont of Bathyaustriella thionipta]|nr:YcaO-like family protein [gamma proteobacterium symbiont of Bathyaustriella thionipta]MCU7951132.1 YcaO-like family protein [gamma proteobacterium symbiont of Bathyaustriella thionipta]MCU7954873.1 YcaO-like family protein [gamma proteobacterium symbiont of Bathyaustriella thionipta]MCU7957647.1 YcaO-like family protein [gamma proteobacterium symbiont of Bathyaustriella thionipta]MCU7967623.1 YcaO-like family protein [gamma proteobacterium symbiont of Bathyaustriella thionipta]